MVKLLKRYILKEHIAPFFISLLVVTFILLIDRVIDLLNVIIEKKLDFSTVMQVFGLSMPFMLALSIPMAVLVATIMAFGRMTVDRETVAMKSCGINIYTMIGPLMIVTLLLSAGMMYFNHFTLPETNHRLKNMMLKIAYYKPMTIIKPGEFTNIADYTVYVKDNSGTELLGIIIYDRSETRFPKIIYAKSGVINQMDNGNSLQIILRNGEMHERNEREQGKYEVRTFVNFTLHIRNLGNNVDFAETGYRSDREMSYKELTAGIKDKGRELTGKRKQVLDYQRQLNVVKLSPIDEQTRREIRRLSVLLRMEQDRVADLLEEKRSLEVEFHKKFALAFAVVIFVLIGMPLGLMTRSSGIGMAFSVSSLIFLVYYIALNGGEQLADKGYTSPFISMWISNFVFLILAILLIIGSIKEKRLFDFQALFQKIIHRKLKKIPMPDEVRF